MARGAPRALATPDGAQARFIRNTIHSSDVLSIIRDVFRYVTGQGEECGKKAMLELHIVQIPPSERSSQASPSSIIFEPLTNYRVATWCSVPNTNVV